jgi:hypothetical protein
LVIKVLRDAIIDDCQSLLGKAMPARAMVGFPLFLSG